MAESVDGERYQATAPNIPDLAERARQGLRVSATVCNEVSNEYARL